MDKWLAKFTPEIWKELAAAASVNILCSIYLEANVHSYLIKRPKDSQSLSQFGLAVSSF